MSADGLPATDHELIVAALRGFGLGEPAEARSLADGLMNRNWRVRTREGVWALKQVLDVDTGLSAAAPFWRIRFPPQQGTKGLAPHRLATLVKATSMR